MEENHIHHLPVIGSDGELLGIVAESDLGRRMSNRELGRLARGVTIRRTGPAYSQVDALMRYPGKEV
jgi:CBS domain-containing protein